MSSYDEDKKAEARKGYWMWGLLLALIIGGMSIHIVTQMITLVVLFFAGFIWFLDFMVDDGQRYMRRAKEDFFEKRAAKKQAAIEARELALKNGDVPR